MYFDFRPDLLQDMCMSCGAYGIDDEGRLISCVQCGQSYHPYCVEVKVDMTSILIGLLLDMIYVLSFPVFADIICILFPFLLSQETNLGYNFIKILLQFFKRFSFDIPDEDIVKVYSHLRPRAQKQITKILYQYQYKLFPFKFTKLHSS